MLDYFRRDCVILDIQLAEKTQLIFKQNEYLKIIRKLYRQQKIMHRSRIHRIPDRIVSILQTWIKPSALGEFAAK